MSRSMIAAKTGLACDPGLSWGRRPQTPGVYRLDSTRLLAKETERLSRIGLQP
jgi:hypothetical protein